MNNDPFIQDIHDFIDRYHLLPPNNTVILGLSGGPDSVFLLHILYEFHKIGRIKLIAAHLDHEWRTDSAQDVTFCKEKTEALNIPFIHEKASNLPDSLQKKGSKEEIGRRMRRYFLQKVQEEYNADLIALGHHAQDQEETFFIRLIRGATLSGLTGMKPRDGVYVRPLLQTNKTDIINYLNIHTISYLIDPSNESPSFLRNRIRLSVLPALRTCDERFDANFLRTMHNLQQTESFLVDLTQQSFKTIAHLKENTWIIDIDSLYKLHPFMQLRAIMHWLISERVPFTPTERFLEEIKRFLFSAEKKEHQIHHAWAIVKKGQSALIHREY
ncbi:MAG: tRNA lysidine(34) synthetase TilS [Candidatus Babeliales bacterium]